LFNKILFNENWPKGLLPEFHGTYQRNDLDHEKLSEAYTTYFQERLNGVGSVVVSESSNSPIVTTVGEFFASKEIEGNTAELLMILNDVDHEKVIPEGRYPKSINNHTLK